MSSWDRVQVERPHAPRALMGGLIATIILIGLMYLGPLIGVRTWNVGAMVGGAISFNELVTPAFRPQMWGLGFFSFVVFSILAAPACYAYWAYSYLPGTTWMRGLLYGGFLWLLVQILLMPMIGQGPFDVHGPAPAVEILSQLVLWLVYGVILGAIAGPQQVWRHRVHAPQEHA